MWARINSETGLFDYVTRHKVDETQVDVADDDPRIAQLADPDAFALQVWDEASGSFVYSIPAVIADQLAVVNQQADDMMDILSGGYPAAEMISWPKQEAEAKALKADPAAVTPFLDKLSALRLMTRYEIASRVLRKVHAFENGAAGIIGRRQRVVDQLQALDPATATVTEVRDLNVVMPATFWADIQADMALPLTDPRFNVPEPGGP